MQKNMEQNQLNTLTTITRWVIRLAAIAMAVAAIKHNPAHLFTACGIWAIGDCVEWENNPEKEGRK